MLVFRLLSRHRWIVLGVVSLVALAGGRYWFERPAEPVAPPQVDLGAGVVGPAPRTVHDVDAVSLAGLKFEDVTESVGLDRFMPRGGDQSFALPTMTAGMAIARLGGRITLLLTSPTGPVIVYQLIDGGFRDVTRSLGLQRAGAATAAAFADLDGDGDRDLLLGRRETRVVSVLRNGSGTFTDVSRDVGVKSATSAANPGDLPDTRGLALADVNGDGHLDFLVSDINRSLFGGATYSPDGGGDVAVCDFNQQLQKLSGSDVDGLSQTRLYLGSEAGRFTDATRAWGLDVDTTLVSTPQFIDVNDDGWQDLVMAGPVCSNRVLLNEDGRGFRQLENSGAEDVPQGYGSVVRDFDDDQVLDWLITGISYPTETGECPAGNPLTSCAGNTLLIGNGDGTFDAAPDGAGLSDSGWAFGAAAEDFSNSGRLDVAVTNGFTGVAKPTTAEQAAGQGSTYFRYFEADPMALFVPGPDDTFIDAAASAGLTDTGAGRALAALDFDEDGRLDLLVNNADSGVKLFRNITPSVGRHWLDVGLRDSTTATNPDAWGSRIRVTSASGEVTNTWLTSNGSFETQTLPQGHFGLGEEGDPVTVEVWWPGDTAPRLYDDVAVDQRVVLKR